MYLRYPPGSLVLVAGLPGAGKSTLLSRLYGLRGDERRPVAAEGALVIDSSQSRNWWAPWLRLLPPRARIPFVFATHTWRIVRGLLGGNSVVAHTRGTHSQVLRAYTWLARRTGSETHLILLDVGPQAARAGQYARGRVLTAGTFARHSRRWRVLLKRVRAGRGPGAGSVTVLDRATADDLRAIRFEPPAVAEPRGASYVSSP